MRQQHRAARWSQGSQHGGTTSDDWGYEHDFAAQVSRAWKLLPDGSPDTSAPEIETDGEGHEYRIFHAIGDWEVQHQDAYEAVARALGEAA